MRKIITWNLMTLDGCFEGPEPWDLGFHTHVWGDELEAFSLEQGEEIGTLLFGRKTYDGMAAHWSKETGPIAQMMNGLPKRVASRTMSRADWSNSAVLEGEAGDAVAAFKAEEGKDIFVFGSADLCDTLLARGLIDECRICLVPVVLGRGNPLFKPGTKAELNLRSARQLKTGGVILTYDVAKPA